ncbi:MAG: hypothetical protein ACI8YQ_000511 [Polaribacter sp.]
MPFSVHILHNNKDLGSTSPFKFFLMKNTLHTLLFCLIGVMGFAQDWSLERSVQISATVETVPARITLNWLSQTTNGFTLYRRLKGENNWGSALADLPGTANTFVDNDVAIGQSYEYRIDKIAPIGGFGAINAGMEIPAVHQRGKLILVVDDTQAELLMEEVNQLIIDIEGDGWAVSKIEVSPTDAVPDVKADIVNLYNEDPDNYRAILLLGHVPVPYAGQNFPDGHADHEGAWPADLYYGEINGNWTDSNVNVSITTDSRNHNTPGDGKFDETVIPSDVDLQVGRIDFANLPAFAETETELLRKYLNKNHAFRHKEFTAEPRGLIENNFGGLPEGFGQNGYRNFSTMFGPGQIDVVDFDSLKTKSYLWSFAAGGGSFTSAGGITNTAQLTQDSLQTVFCMLFGSYFGDWDSENNLLRSMLASGTVLTNVWAGRPKYQFEHMSLGENIGYGLPLTQNTATNFLQDTCYGGRLIHIALMGDPTLRMHVVAPVGPSLTIAEDQGNINLGWTASIDADLGYNIYRKETGAAFFELQNPEPVTALNYTIDCVEQDKEYIYMVRALRLEESASGSYYNMSQGVMGSYTLQVGCISAVSEIEGLEITISPNPANDFLQVKLEAPGKKDFQLQLLNTIGQVVLEKQVDADGTTTLLTNNLSGGVYLLMIQNESGEVSSKKVIII